MVHSGGPYPLGRLTAADAALHEEIDVRRAGLVSAEAEPERVLQVVDVEVLGAALVRTVQKRAMFDGVWHRVSLPSDTLSYRPVADFGVKSD
jgi:hypothetical protein